MMTKTTEATPTGAAMTNPWWYFCKVCKERLSKKDAMTICDKCLSQLGDRENGTR